MNHCHSLFSILDLVNTAFIALITELLSVYCGKQWAPQLPFIFGLRIFLA